MAVRESPQDTLIIKNIDVGCDEVSSELVRKDRTQTDDNGHNYIAYEEVPEEFSHADHFLVKFDGHPFKIKAGETRLMPRYVAEHYAKHLANHILQKREIREGKGGWVNHPTERPKILKQIVLGVEQYFYDDEENLDREVGSLAQRQVEQLNREDARKVHDLGSIDDKDPVPNKALGRLDAPGDAPQSLEEVLAGVEDEPATEQRNDTVPVLNQPAALSKRELVEAAHSQGIKVTGKETKEELAAKIKATV